MRPRRVPRAKAAQLAALLAAVVAAAQSRMRRPEPPAPVMAGAWMCVRHTMSDNCAASTDQCVIEWQGTEDEPTPPPDEQEWIRSHCLATGARTAAAQSWKAGT